MSATGLAEVVREYIDESFDLRTPVRVLRWEQASERLWELPEGLCVTGLAPTRLGLSIRRDGDTYTVRLLWDRTQLTWEGLSKLEILGSCLGPLLGAQGLDLWSMLDQAVMKPRLRAA